MNKPHLRYYGTVKFDICSTLNSSDVETKLKHIFMRAIFETGFYYLYLIFR